MKPVNPGWTCRVGYPNREIGVFRWDYCKDCQPYEPVTFEEAMASKVTFELLQGINNEHL
jgi:hypothetical protein